MSKSYLKFLYEITKSRFIFNLRNLYRRETAQVDTTDTKQHLINLRNHGYSIIYNYLSEAQCGELRAKVDQAVVDYPMATWSGVLGADKRIFGIENVGGGFLNFHKDQFLREIGRQYIDCRIENLLTLAARIDAVKGNLGSGEGWHRDGNHFQFKVLVYLSDVKHENGPFQLIDRSHRYPQVVSDNFSMQTEDSLGTRFSDEQVSLLLAQQPERLITLAAPAGTAVLVDTSTIHRGSPIQQGRRYALFNYYYPYYDIDGRRAKFAPTLEPELIKQLAQQ
jgi:hypothetical protein